MPISIVYNQELALFDAEFAGRIRLEDLAESMKRTLSLVQLHRCFLFLADVTRATFELSAYCS